MIKYLVAIIAFAGFSLTAQAQTTLKLGHINTTQLLGMMPETKNADSLLQKFGASLESQLKTMTGEYQNKISDFKAKESSMADPVRDAKVKEIGDLEQRIQDFQESAQNSMQKKKEELYSPVIKKAEEAINGVAKEKGFTYIFDTSVGAVLFASDSDDIMPLVKAKLGLK
jgi:outer membrane protein